MTSAPSNALKHWAHIIQRWPVDKVRPESVAFQKLMQQRISRSTQSVSPTKDTPKTNIEEARPWNETKEMREANALYNLLDNRFSKQYPMPESLRHPRSSPSHYDDVVREMEEAPTRSWFGNVMNRVRGSLRRS